MKNESEREREREPAMRGKNCAPRLTEYAAMPLMYPPEFKIPLGKSKADKTTRGGHQSSFELEQISDILDSATSVTKRGIDECDK